MKCNFHVFWSQKETSSPSTAISSSRRITNLKPTVSYIQYCKLDFVYNLKYFKWLRDLCGKTSMERKLFSLAENKAEYIV